jgi:hypothetical protein
MMRKRRRRRRRKMPKVLETCIMCKILFHVVRLYTF